MLPTRTGWQGTRQIGGRFSHLEPPKSVCSGRIKVFPDCVWNANMTLSKGYVD